MTKFLTVVQVTFVEALDQLMPGFDPEIGKLAQRVLINPRKIDYHTGVFATKVLKLGFFFFYPDMNILTSMVFSFSFLVGR